MKLFNVKEIVFNFSFKDDMVSIFKPDDANGDCCLPSKKHNNALLLNKIGGL
jgi:hypothetical protein